MFDWLLTTMPHTFSYGEYILYIVVFTLIGFIGGFLSGKNDE